MIFSRCACAYYAFFSIQSRSKMNSLPLSWLIQKSILNEIKEEGFHLNIFKVNILYTSIHNMRSLFTFFLILSHMLAYTPESKKYTLFDTISVLQSVFKYSSLKLIHLFSHLSHFRSSKYILIKQAFYQLDMLWFCFNQLAKYYNEGPTAGEDHKF